MEKVEKRRSFLINVAFFALIFGAIYVFMRFVFWPLFPFLFAFFFAMIMQRPVNFIVRKTPLKKGITSFLVTFITFVLILGLLVLVGSKIVTEIRDFIQHLIATYRDIPNFISQARIWVMNRLASWPVTLRKTVRPYVRQIFDAISQSVNADETAETSSSIKLSSLISPISNTVGGVISTAGKVPSILISVVVGFIACCFITSDYPRITGFIKRQMSPAKAKALSHTKNLTLNTIKKMLLAYFKIIIVTFTEIAIGLGILKLAKIYTGGYIILIALGIAIVDILPILGSGTILIPWSLISLVSGNVSMFVGLLIMYIVITVLRQVIEPRLVAGQLGLPPVVTLIGMYIGLKLFSVLGMFIVPLVITVLSVLNEDGVINIWKTKPDTGLQNIPASESLNKVITVIKKGSRKKNGKNN